MDQVNKQEISILCVDDNRGIRELLQVIVAGLGHNSVTAMDGIEALGRLKDNTFDIVITDLKMPRMDGIELIKKIRTDFNHVDVIAITGYQMTYKYTELIALGASDFISKPFKVNELEAKISRIIRERELRAELEWLSNRDGLTGLHNRRSFDSSLKHEASRALRQNYSLYLLLIDLDGLKACNDEYGHQQGDKLLIELGKIILSNVRKSVDSAYRYGGDEFAIILPHANRQQALMVAERLLVKYNNRDLSPSSLSIGLAKLDGSLETLQQDLESLIGNADQALYCAKANGGNRVCDEQGEVALARDIEI